MENVTQRDQRFPTSWAKLAISREKLATSWGKLLCCGRPQCAAALLRGCFNRVGSLSILEDLMV